MATDESSCSARTSAIHKEKFNVPLSGDEPMDLSNVVKYLKTFTGLAEIAKSKCLREKPEASHDCHIMLFHHTEVQKAISFLQEPSKTRVNLKYQSKGLIYTLHLLSFVEIRLFNVFFWERKTEFGKMMKKLCGMRDSREKGAGMRNQDTPPPPPPLPDPQGTMQKKISQNIQSTHV